MTQSKVRITTYIDEDILNRLKKVAEKKNTKYQTLLNQLLRNGLKSKSTEFSPKQAQQLESIVAKAVETQLATLQFERAETNTSEADPVKKPKNNQLSFTF